MSNHKGEHLNELTQIDLFSGIGGFALAARWAGFRTVAFCERDEWCQRVLAKNFGAVVADATSQQSASQQPTSNEPHQSDGLSCQSGRGNSPILIPDIFDFDGTAFAGATLLTGGFPCQPFSCAGKRKGTADDRALWPQMARVIAEAKPRWIVGENVAGLVTMELDNVLSDLESIRYTVWTAIIPACGVDARHKRDRVWIVAHADRTGFSKRCGAEPIPAEHATTQHGDSRRSETAGQFESRMGHLVDGLSAGMAGGFASWPEEDPQIPRVAVGVKDRVAKLKGLGNAIVPQVAFEILRVIAEIETMSNRKGGKYANNAR